MLWLILFGIRMNLSKNDSEPYPVRFDKAEPIAANIKATMSTCPLLLITISVLFLLLISSCSTVQYRSDPQLVGYTERGIASFYAMKFQFRKTSSGERFNQFASTAAHRTLPFGTRVRVTNVRNNQSVIVKINDRGPFIDGRIIDLTRYAFSRIGDIERGLLKVKIEVIN